MKPNEIEKILIGKTISKITHHGYMGWPMCIDEIHFTDGTIVELSGNADEAIIENLIINGKFISVNDS